MGPRFAAARGGLGAAKIVVQSRAKPRSVSLVRSIASKTAPQHTELSELDLHAAIKAGASDWQKQAFHLFHGLVGRLVVKSLGPNSEIEDLVSDVFVSFFESAHKIRTPTAVRSYIVSITMNVVRREVRRRKFRAVFGRLTRTSEEVERKPGPDDPRAKAALLQLSRILDELSVGERMAFVLHNLEGMPVIDVAEALDISLSTARRRVQRASEHLRKRVSRNALLSDYVMDRAERVDD